MQLNWLVWGLLMLAPIIQVGWVQGTCMEYWQDLENTKWYCRSVSWLGRCWVFRRKPSSRGELRERRSTSGLFRLLRTLLTRVFLLLQCLPLRKKYWTDTKCKSKHKIMWLTLNILGSTGPGVIYWYIGRNYFFANLLFLFNRVSLLAFLLN